MSAPTELAGGTVTLGSELTIATAGESKDDLFAALDAADDDDGLALDLGAVEDFDVAGLQLLLALRRAAVVRRVPFRLVNLSERVTTVLRIVGLSEGWTDDRG